jgi:hypothetical protein
MSLQRKPLGGVLLETKATKAGGLVASTYDFSVIQDRYGTRTERRREDHLFNTLTGIIARPKADIL